MCIRLIFNESMLSFHLSNRVLQGETGTGAAVPKEVQGVRCAPLLPAPIQPQDHFHIQGMENHRVQ